jgi:hypothetical protein
MDKLKQGIRSLNTTVGKIDTRRALIILHESLIDAYNCCGFSSYVNKDGETCVNIECIVDEDEKERVWDLLTFKHKRDCSISVEPSDILYNAS